MSISPPPREEEEESVSSCHDRTPENANNEVSMIDKDQGTITNDNSSQDDDGMFIGVPHWAISQNPRRKDVTNTQDILQHFRPKLLRTNHGLPEGLLHNFYAQSLAVRDLPGSYIGSIENQIEHLDELLAANKKLIDEIAEVRLWLLTTLITHTKQLIKSGLELLYITLGPTVGGIRVSMENAA
jgi:hypothetical protein